jgi:hypothetical protein
LPDKLTKSGIPHIDRVTPAAAIPGGDVVIHGGGFAMAGSLRPHVRFGDAEASLLFHADKYMIARVPEGAGGGIVRVETGAESLPYPISVGVQVADNLHPVTNPAVDSAGNIYVTFSGERGKRVPVSLYKVTANYTVKPFTTQLVNALRFLQT